MDPLRDGLEQLARELLNEGVPLIVGGGYGLVLRTEHVQENELRTLRDYPAARSTQDLDLFLSAEVVVDAEKMQAIREALDALGYKPIEGAKYYQFVRKVEHLGRERDLKIDLLAQVPSEKLELVKMDKRRIRPRKYGGLHAHTTTEAFTVDRNVLPIHLGPAADPVIVYVPHPFSYLILKLFAFRDQANSDKGAYHAFDLYRTVAMMTQEEWDESGELRDESREVDALLEAQRIVQELFAGANEIGILRMQEHARLEQYPLSREVVIDFVNDLHELILGVRDPT